MTTTPWCRILCAGDQIVIKDFQAVVVVDEREKMTQIAPRIVVDPAIRSGRPVILGTRVPVEVILGKLAAGMSFEEVAGEYDLVREDILAVLSYAAGEMLWSGSRTRHPFPN